jgi:hypothetical protein
MIDVGAALRRKNQISSRLKSETTIALDFQKK